MVEVARNYCSAPTGGTDRWTISGATLSVVNGVLRATSTITGGKYLYWGWTSVYAPASPGQQWTVTAEVRLPAGGATQGINAYLTAMSGSGGSGQLDALAGITSVPADGAWHPIRFTRAATPAGTQYMALALYFNAATVGDWFEVRHVMLTPTADPVPEFDGDTPDTDNPAALTGERYSWTGTRLASASIHEHVVLTVAAVPGGADGGQVVRPGQLQYGALLLGGGTSAGWRELAGWRERPSLDLADSMRPQAHGAYPGDVFTGERVVTFTFLLRGAPDAKATAVDALERYLPVDSVERFLTVDDGTGPWFTMARVTGLHIPQGKHYRHAPLECSVQFTCADPRRYSGVAKSATVTLPVTSGGLAYPLVYPLDYGTSSSGSGVVTNNGSASTPLRGALVGPLTNPTVRTAGWSVAFDLVLAAGDFLALDATEGTAMLNGTADRLYALSNTSDPLEACMFDPGDTSVTLSADAGTGHLDLSYRDARL